MSSAGVIEPINVLEDGDFSGSAGLPELPPDQFRLDGLEEGFHCGVIVAITLAAHGYFEAILAQQFLVVMRAILAPAIRMVNTAFGWPSHGRSRRCGPPA